MTTFICPLASGSLGNALLVATAKARVLVDLGISRRRLKASLAAAGVRPEEIQAVLVTHTHRDHLSPSAVGFCLAGGVPVYSTEDNLAHFAHELEGFADLVAAGLVRAIDGHALRFGDVAAEAFPVPHDSVGQCLGFRLTAGGPRARRTVAVATDLGHLPQAALDAFIDADAVVIESNHDPEMLRASGRPWELIERIAGPHGHLSNETCAEALAQIVGRSHPGKVAHVVLAHLSRDCNHPRLALAAQAHLSRSHSHPIRLAAASQYAAGPVVAL
jgi:phosphoribosyl 1,2-cyclic phosphodiesterase